MMHPKLPLTFLRKFGFNRERRLIALSTDIPDPDKREKLQKSLVAKLQNSTETESLTQMSREFLSDDGKFAMQSKINELTMISQRIRLLLPEDDRATLQEVIPTSSDDMVELLISEIGIMSAVEYGELIRKATRQKERSKTDIRRGRGYIESLLSGSREPKGNKITRYDKNIKRKLTLVRTDKESEWKIVKEETMDEMRASARKARRKITRHSGGRGKLPKYSAGKRLPKWITGEQYLPGERKRLNRLAGWGRDRFRYERKLKRNRIRAGLELDDSVHARKKSMTGYTPEQWAALNKYKIAPRGESFISKVRSRGVESDESDHPFAPYRSGEKDKYMRDQAYLKGQYVNRHENQIIKDIKLKKYEKYKDDPEYKKVINAFRNAYQTWPSNPDRRYGDLVWFRSQMKELEKRYKERELKSRRVEKSSSKTDEEPVTKKIKKITKKKKPAAAASPSDVGMPYSSSPKDVLKNTLGVHNVITEGLEEEIKKTSWYDRIIWRSDNRFIISDPFDKSSTVIIGKTKEGEWVVANRSDQNTWYKPAELPMRNPHVKRKLNEIEESNN